MTAFLFTAVWERSQASDSALLILMAIAEAADATGRATIEQRTIARRARVHVSTVGRAIRTLEELGEIVVEFQATGRKPATYVVKDALDVAICNAIDVATAAVDSVLSEDDVEEVIPMPPPDPEDTMQALMAPPDLAPEPRPLPVRVAREVVAMTPALDQKPPEPPVRPMPSHLPPNDLGKILAALGVKPDARGQLFWWRTEHRDDLAEVLAETGETVPSVLQRIEEGGIRADALASVLDLAHILGVQRG